ncbi:MAG: glycosyltransferase [Nitrospira sp.]|jgi:hypothetical protein|nr:glycosyltransferase [Nitrospira sp.]
MSNGRSWPHITVVTPSFNQGQYLEETIRSVLLQGYPNLEYIVVDGGSTDSSVEVITHYAPWITFWVSEKDKGQTDAINKGFARATGTILAWLNSDDVYTEGALWAVAKFFSAHPDLDIGYGACRSLDAMSRCRAIHVPSEFQLKRLLSSNFIAQPATFFSRQALDAVGGLNQKYHFAFDYGFWMKAALQGRSFARIPGPPLAGFRTWQQSKSEASFEEFMRETTAIVTDIFEEAPASVASSSMRNLALSSGWRFAALGYWRNGQGMEARRCLRQVLWLAPCHILDLKLLLLYMSSFLSVEVISSLRKIKQSINRMLHTPA